MHDYVEKAFTYARAADPNAKLFYNDFAMERYSGKNKAIFNLVQSLVDKGVPIDGVGFQMHIKPDWTLTRENLASLFKQYGDLGLEVHITELDIELCERTNGV
jgi:endo-1,4-beta-xylanase